MVEPSKKREEQIKKLKEFIVEDRNKFLKLPNEV